MFNAICTECENDMYEFQLEKNCVPKHIPIEGLSALEIEMVNKIEPEKTVVTQNNTPVQSCSKVIKAPAPDFDFMIFSLKMVQYTASSVICLVILFFIIAMTKACS
jgi:hypothetical protein